MKHSPLMNTTVESHEQFSVPYLRIIAFGVIFTVLNVLYLEFSILHTTYPSVNTLVLSFVSGLLLGAAAGFVSTWLPLSTRSRLAVLWVTLFVIQFFANLIEGTFFTTRISTAAIFIGGTLVSLAMSLAEAMAVVSIFKPRVPIQDLVTSLKSFFANRSAVSWLGIVILASVAYFPVYFTFGAIVSPFVLPYYTDPSNGLSLALPTLPTLVVVELLRGFLFVGALIPILATLKASNRAYFLSLASLFFIAGAFIPFITNTSLPLFLKSVHGLEILGDSIVYAAILTYLFRRPRLSLHFGHTASQVRNVSDRFK